jgi:predicted solute-binding protein
VRDGQEQRGVGDELQEAELHVLVLVHEMVLEASSATGGMVVELGLRIRWRRPTGTPWMQGLRVLQRKVGR